MYREIYTFLLLFMWVSAERITVTVKQGTLLGHREASVFDGRLYFAFFGVPYAKPPIGELRFKDPEPMLKWKSPYDATTVYNGACAQTHITHKHGLYGAEDCLYLNIYTPSIPKNENTNLKPVIIWIHGYAFASCFSHIHKPDFLVTNDVILVTVAHRIGVFGFLKLNDTESTGNMGLKDIVMALKWVRANIKQFGGDKHKITLMGNGSGATFISLLLTTEVSNLFSKVILQSGAIFSPSVFQGDPNSERTRLYQELKRKHLKLRDASTKDILDAAQNIFIRNNKEMENLQRPIIPFTPTVEANTNASLLVWTPQEFFDTVKSKNIPLNKPILIGYNTQESISEIIPFIHNPYYLKTFIKFFKFFVPFSDGCNYKSTTKTYKEISKIVKDRYFKESDTDKALESLLKYASDLLIFPILKFVKMYLSLTKSSMYMYKFDYRGSLNAVKATSLAENKVRVSGVASGDEICYILRCEPLWESYVLINNDEENKDKKFIKEISLMWANFAKFGEPTPYNSDSNVTWPPVNSKLGNVMLIRKYLKLISSKDENAMYDFWNLLYETYYKKEKCNEVHDEL